MHFNGNDVIAACPSDQRRRAISSLSISFVSNLSTVTETAAIHAEIWDSLADTSECFRWVLHSISPAWVTSPPPTKPCSELFAFPRIPRPEVSAFQTSLGCVLKECQRFKTDQYTRLPADIPSSRDRHAVCQPVDCPDKSTQFGATAPTEITITADDPSIDRAYSHWLGTRRVSMSSVNRPARSSSRWTNPMSATPINQAAETQITQRLLLSYLRLQDQAKTIDQALVILKRQLNALYESKADVEPGPLDIQWEEHQSKAFSSEKIAEVIGKQDTIALRKRIKPTVTRLITVVDRSRC